MKAIDTPDSVAGQFSGGTALLGYLDATVVPAWWLNQEQNEMLAIMAAAGVAPDATGVNQAQVLAALYALFVKQGGGPGQLSNAVHIGWSGTKVKVAVDATDEGAIALESWVPGAIVAAFSSGSNANGHWRISPDGDVEQWGEVAQPTTGGFNNIAVTFPIPFPSGVPPTGIMITTANTTAVNNGGSYYAKTATAVDVAMNAPLSFSWFAKGR